MKFSDLLRKAAEALETSEAETSEPKMMPPQTQELELAKKMAGVPSEFDNQEQEAPCACGSDEPEQELMACANESEVDRLRKLSGL